MEAKMAESNVRRLPMVVGVFLALVVLNLPGALHAQVTGTISGYVTDPSGAAVPQVKVTATLVQQNVTRTTESNAEGFYNFPALLPGTYTLTAEKSAFQRLTQTDVVLTVNQNVRLDMALQLGAITQTVTVTGEAPLVDTRSPTLSGLVDDRRVVDLPLNGRNVIALARTLPGVLNVNAPQQLSDARSGPEMDVNGGRPNMNLFTFNGAYFMNPSRNTGMNYPPPDAIQEFRILTNNFSAEYGRNPGSQVNVVSKTGTNEFHGAVWEFLRNDALNARGFFASRVPGQKQNQFGFAAGGPVRKDKLFAFGTYQALRDRREADTIVATLPSDAHRNGDFTDLLPLELVNPAGFTDPAGNPCVVDNVISPDCISPVTKNLLPFLPSTPQGGDVVSLAPNPRRGDMFMVRLDANLSSKHTMFGHFFYDRNSRKTPFGAGGNIPGYVGGSLVQGTHSVAVNDTYAFSPNLINQFVASYLRSTSNDFNTQTRTPESLGMNLPMYTTSGAPDFNVGDMFDLGTGYIARFASHNWQFRDTLSSMRGRHGFKFGGEFMRLQFLQDWNGPTSFYFSGSRAGDPVADFLLGAYDNLFLDFGQRLNDASSNYLGFFFQDEFKVNPRFTLTFGARYEYFAPWIDANNRINTIVVGAQSMKVPDAPPGILFPGDLPRGLVNGDMNNLSPRIGFAWDLFGNGKTSIRGAYGVFYEAVNADSLAQENAPFSGFGTATYGNLTDPYGSVGLTPPPVAPPGDRFGCVSIPEPPGLRCDLFPLPIGGVFTDLSLRTPYVQSWNLSIQRQLTPDIMLEAAYAGKIGTKIEAMRTYNPARFIPGTVYDPATELENMVSTPDNIYDRVLFEPGILSPQGFLLGNDFRSWYHSFQTQVTKRFSRGLSVISSYTLGKSIDSSSTDNLGGTVFNPFNLHQERGRSDWDRRHAFVASWLWSPPWKFAEGWKNTLLGGWTFTGIHSIQSGLPITFLSGDDVAVDGTYGDQLAFLTGEPIARSHSSRGDMVSQFFNTNAFVYPNCAFDSDAALGNPQAIEQQNCTPFGIVYSLAGQYGNAGRGILSGPAYNSTDFSVIKDFAFKERYKAQFRSEFFNVFNQVNFDNPTNYVNSGAFGRIRSAGDGRIVQFALKFLW
jgi:hypothetical protein